MKELRGLRRTMKLCPVDMNWVLNDEHKTTRMTCRRPSINETWK